MPLNSKEKVADSALVGQVVNASIDLSATPFVLARGAESQSGVLSTVLRKPEARAYITAVRNQLDEALGRWWGYSQVPGPELLRDGLLLLEAGDDLVESQRSLLLRAALSCGKGMVTAMRHQRDPERTASILKDALLDPNDPLPPEKLWWLQHEDDAQAEWSSSLRAELKATLPTTIEPTRTLTKIALAQLESKRPLQVQDISHSEQKLSIALPRIPTLQWPLSRWAILSLVAVAASLLYFWQQRSALSADMVEVPAGSYLMRDAGGQTATPQEIPAFLLDRNEVTQRDYRLCVQAKHCRPINQLTNQSGLDNYPVANVDWQQANTFCTWLGKRLPILAEWQVAASFAPATQRYFGYPWGDTFVSTLTNGRAAQRGGVQAVGSYHPRGDSPLGVMDMAGNVAEWTADSSGEAEQGWAAGGSFINEAAALQSFARQSLAKNTVAPWLGFRCAVTIPDASAGEDAAPAP